MTAQFLTLRLTAAEAELVSRLRSTTGLSKSEIVKRALHSMADATGVSAGDSLYDLGAAHFGRHGDASRQAADIKAVVRARLNAKHTGRASKR